MVSPASTPQVSIPQIVIGPLLVLCLVCAGCFTYRQAPVESLPVGSTVRLHLTSSGANRAGELTGEPASRMAGTLVRAGRDTVVIEVWRTDLARGRAFDPGRQRIVFQREKIVGIEKKEISYWKTGGLVGAIAGGLYLLYEAISSAAGGGLDSDPPPGGGHGAI